MITVDITDDGKFVIVKIDDKEVKLEDRQVSDLINELKDKQFVAKAKRNGWISCA